MDEGQQSVPPNNPPSRKDPGVASGELTEALQKIRTLLLGTVSDMAEGLAAQEALQRSLNKDKLASSKDERAALKLIAEDRVQSFTKDQQTRLAFEKQLAGVRAAGERLLTHAGTPEAKEAVSRQIDTAEAGLKKAYAEKQPSTIGTVVGGVQDIFAAGKELYSTIKGTVAVKQALELGVADAKAKTALFGAGVKGGENIFAGIEKMAPGVLSPSEMKNFTKILADISPRAFKSSEGLTQMIGVLANFGYTVEESMAAVADASARLNWSFDDVAGTAAYASTKTNDLNMSTKDITGMIMNMTEATRAGGTESTELIGTILKGFNKHIASLNMEMSKSEITKYTQGLTGALASMSLENLTGIISFNRGSRGLPSVGDVTGGMQNPANVFQTFFNKTIKGMGGMAEIFATQAAATKLLGYSPNKEELFKLHDTLAANKLNSADVTKLAPTEELARSGYHSLVRMVNPLERIEKHTAGILTGISMLISEKMQSKFVQEAGTKITLGKDVYDVGKEGYEGIKVIGGAIKAAKMAMEAAG